MSQQQTLDITTLPTPQLSQLQSRLSSDLEHLSTSHARLRAAQTRFKDCIRCIADGVENKDSGGSHSSPSFHLLTYAPLSYDLTNVSIHRYDAFSPPDDIAVRPSPTKPYETQHRPRGRGHGILRGEKH